MPPVPATPAAVLPAAARADATRPRLTWYHGLDDAARGERVELSARVLGTWAAKTAGLLVDELDLEPGDVVRLDLPPHWRTAYWALGVWTAGGVVALDDDPSSDEAVVVTDRPGDHPDADRLVALSLPALARRWHALDGGALPAGATDEAAELMLHPDVFDAADPTSGTATALVAGGTTSSAQDVVAAVEQRASDLTDGERLGLLVPGRAGLAELLVDVLAAWSRDGSAVVVTGAVDDAVLADRWSAERVTSSGAPGGTAPARR
ncbi:TIGR03089 family protein [Angustibacter peucedani]